MEIHKIMNPSAESAQYLFTLVMISLHNSSQHTTSQTKATSLSAKRRKHVLNIIPLTGKRQIGSINGQKF